MVCLPPPPCRKQRGATVHVLAGFEKPSAIQQRAIKPIVKGRDVIAQYDSKIPVTAVQCLTGACVRMHRSQSGTGKTATFSISALQTIDTQTRCVHLTKR